MQSKESLSLYMEQIGVDERVKHTQTSVHEAVCFLGQTNSQR